MKIWLLQERSVWEAPGVFHFSKEELPAGKPRMNENKSVASVTNIAETGNRDDEEENTLEQVF